MREYIKTLRRMIGNTKIIVPGVRALILDGSGALLLGRQAAFDSWSLPHGCVDLDESAFEACVRETREEVGITIVQADLYGIYTDPKYSVVYPNGDQVQTFTMAFVAREWTGTPTPDGEEIVEVGFFALDRLPAPIYHVHADTLEDFRRSPVGVVVK